MKVHLKMPQSISSTDSLTKDIGITDAVWVYNPPNNTLILDLGWVTLEAGPEEIEQFFAGAHFLADNLLNQ